METLTFKLEDFEGPLDLLLALIAKNKMNIYDINILELIDQYMNVVNASETYEMEATSEFIEMAARLVQMKSYFLLPRSDEGERLKQELTGLLVEYSQCKLVAETLREMASTVHTAVRTPMEIEIDETYTRTHKLKELLDAYNSIKGRNLRKAAPSQERFEPIVQAPFVSVTSRIIHVLRSLTTGKIKSLQQLFHSQTTRSGTVATFLAVLELIRAGRITVSDDESVKVNKATKRSKEMAKEASEWN